MTRKVEPPESLGLGKLEATINDEAPPSVERARDYFLDRLAEIAPDVMGELAGEPFELFKQTPLCFEADNTRLASLIGLSVVQESVERFQWAKAHAWQEAPQGLSETVTLLNPFADSPFADDESVRLFVASLRDWSRRNHLAVHWLRKRAYETLALWSADVEALNSCRWREELHFPRFAETKEFIFKFTTSYPAYTPMRLDETNKLVLPSKSNDSRIETEQVMREAFEKQMKQWLDVSEADFKNVPNREPDPRRRAGKVMPVPVKRAWRHFDWLIQWQVLKHSKSRIAREAETKADRKSVIDALPDVACLIGLPLRPAEEK